MFLDSLLNKFPKINIDIPKRESANLQLIIANKSGIIDYTKVSNLVAFLYSHILFQINEVENKIKII